ncbi:hypothetical protein KTO58_18355 [Chitinophaga pendula]|uniref:hypothetical protein n=1 Tax=Chitinophaga TaxID=79328 RepID=UPI000BAE9596|nr:MULTISPECIES: hypothetical protein [Chitinophaga]ASZ11360.1 hypothetical protein CK934_10460 [Chitinophaga sp. MD30]UCJ05638.1 hypothetical protein KTO58_18355 [Chitinophaga pendula]
MINRRTVLLALLFVLCCNYSFAQSEYLIVKDTARAYQEPPSYFKQQVDYRFKNPDAVGFSPLRGYVGLMTIAPWRDNTGNKNYQLGFLEAGVYYRQGAHGGTWEDWHKLVMTAPSGVTTLDGYTKITRGGANLALGPGVADHSFMSFFARSNTPETRSGWMGYGASGDKTLSITNEIDGGDIVLLPGGNGNVGIGVQAPPAKLTVNGVVLATRMRVSQNLTWPDFVFKKDYQLPSLQELDTYIQQHQHLPEIPSAQDIARDGQDLGEMNRLLLKKLEEVTLYIIQQDKRINALEQQLKNK